MFKLFTCLLLLGVVFGELDEENDLKAYFRSLYPNHVEKSPQAPKSIRTEQKACARRKLDEEEKDRGALVQQIIPQPSQAVKQPNPINSQLEKYPVVTVEEIKECLETKMKNKMNKKLLDSQQHDKKQNQVTTVTISPVPDESIAAASDPVTVPGKNEIQSGSLQLQPEHTNTRQGSMIIYPITPRPPTDDCVDYTANYPDVREMRRSFNALETDRVNDARSSDQLSKQGYEEFDDPTNRIGVSVYNKGNVMVPGSPRICYACSTLNNPTCTHPSKQTTVKYCSNDRNSCVTKSYEGIDGPILIRDCAKACNDTVLPAGLVPKYKTCSVCHSDLCNAAFSINTENILFALFITVATIYRTLN